MQRDPRAYAEAARLLWDLPPDRLAALASGDSRAAQSVRDAAHMALGVKREFLDPQEFGSERAALDRLAANLAMLPDFSLQEIALVSGRGPIRPTPSTSPIALEPKSPARRRVLRVAVAALLLLLALEALAQAGVPVPSPIGAVVDGVGGEPRSHGSRETSRSAPHDVTDDAVLERGFLPLPAADVAKERTAARVTKPKNENHAKGRLLAQGRDAPKDKKENKEKKVDPSRSTGREAPGRPDGARSLGRSVGSATHGIARAQEVRQNNKGRGRGPR